MYKIHAHIHICMCVHEQTEIPKHSTDADTQEPFKQVLVTPLQPWDRFCTEGLSDLSSAIPQIKGKARNSSSELQFSLLAWSQAKPVSCHPVLPTTSSP